ncbi:MAG: flagellar hook-length control protein FliK, partial [Methyloligellaceae bacterium]
MNGLANSIGELLLPTQGAHSDKSLKSLEASLTGEGGGESFLNILENLAPAGEINQNNELGSGLLAQLTDDLSIQQNIASDLSDSQNICFSGFLDNLNAHLEKLQHLPGTAGNPLAQEINQFLTNNPGLGEKLEAFPDKNAGNLTPESRDQLIKLADRLQSLNIQDLSDIPGLGTGRGQSAEGQDKILASLATELPAQQSKDTGLPIPANSATLKANSIAALGVDAGVNGPDLIKGVAGESTGRISNPLQGDTLQTRQQSADNGHQSQLQQSFVQEGDPKSDNPVPLAKQSEQQDTREQIVRSPLLAEKTVKLESQSSLSLPDTVSVPGSGLQTAQGTNTGHVSLFTSNGVQSQSAVPLNAIAVHIASQAGKGLRKFEIRLDPPELGRIDVRLEVNRDGAARAHLIVERPETLDMLQRDARALEKALTDSGLQTNKDNLSFSLKNQNFAGNQFLDSEGTGNQADSDLDVETE